MFLLIQDCYLISALHSVLRTGPSSNAELEVRNIRKEKRERGGKGGDGRLNFPSSGTYEQERICDPERNDQRTVTSHGLFLLSICSEIPNHVLHNYLHLIY